MAEQTKFEAGKTPRPAACELCEALLLDAVDGTLTEAEQRTFDAHVAGCVACAQELEEAQRGAAWLGILKSQAVEPPAGLLAKILAETSGVRVSAAEELALATHVATSHVSEARHGAPSVVAHRAGWGERFASIREKLAGSFRVEFAQASFQPRLAMTAAMAFFSVALTLNLTGVKLHELRASDFTPSGVHRAVGDMSASAAREFRNNRLVYRVESRVSELRSEEAPVQPNEERR